MDSLLGAGAHEADEEEGGEEEAGDEGGGVGEAEAFGGDEDVAGDDDGHEGGGDGGQPVELSTTAEPYGSGPEEAGGEGLVGPGEVAPQDVEIHEDEGCRDGEEGQGDNQAAPHLLLTEMKDVGDDEAGGAVGGVAAGDGCCHDTENGEDSADAAHPGLADQVDEERGVGAVAAGVEDGREGVVGFLADIVTRRHGLSGGELDGGGSPYHGDDALGDHGAVEDDASATLILQTARHEGRLRGMKAADGTAGDGDAEEGEDREALGVMGEEGRVGDLRHPTILCEEAEAHADGHDEQGGAEERVEAADEGVDGQQCGQHAVEEHKAEPHPAPGAHIHSPHATGHGGEEACGGGDEDGADGHEEDDAEDAHTLTGDTPQFVAHDFRQRSTILAQRDHTAEIVVDSAHEDAAEDDPQVGGRTEEDAHDGTEDGACAGDVEELNEIDTPRGHRDVVGTVLQAVRRGLAIRLHTEAALYEATVEEETSD